MLLHDGKIEEFYSIFKKNDREVVFAIDIFREFNLFKRKKGEKKRERSR